MTHVELFIAFRPLNVSIRPHSFCPDPPGEGVYLDGGSHLAGPRLRLVVSATWWPSFPQIALNLSLACAFWYIVLPSRDRSALPIVSLEAGCFRGIEWRKRMSLYDQQDEEQEASIATNKPLPRWGPSDQSGWETYCLLLHIVLSWRITID